MIYHTIIIPNKIECLKNTMYVECLEHGAYKTKGGIVMQGDKIGDGTSNFIHPRWAKVIFKANNITNVDVGDWILLDHGRWSTSISAEINGVKKDIWYINPESYKIGLLAKSTTKPSSLDYYLN